MASHMPHFTLYNQQNWMVSIQINYKICMQIKTGKTEFWNSYKDT